MSLKAVVKLIGATSGALDQKALGYVMEVFARVTVEERVALVRLLSEEEVVVALEALTRTPQEDLAALHRMMAGISMNGKKPVEPQKKAARAVKGRGGVKEKVLAFIAKLPADALITAPLLVKELGVKRAYAGGLVQRLVKAKVIQPRGDRGTYVKC